MSRLDSGAPKLCFPAPPPISPQSLLRTRAVLLCSRSTFGGSLACGYACLLTMYRSGADGRGCGQCCSCTKRYMVDLLQALSCISGRQMDLGQALFPRSPSSCGGQQRQPENSSPLMIISHLRFSCRASRLGLRRFHFATLSCLGLHILAPFTQGKPAGPTSIGQKQWMKGDRWWRGPRAKRGKIETTTMEQTMHPPHVVGVEMIRPQRLYQLATAYASTSRGSHFEPHISVNVHLTNPFTLSLSSFRHAPGCI
ncbi:hypothetical protein QBC38DRAFT_1211 [Podospora fimiseda]|uniref:Uncharacterized protein n=1 Tax=Podospora fimiseda TaxID=252190 RepID=A0AAN7BZE6_9PEZI|nr:hypothetical protein QBC38DRAFT_1211 [Podospora fimiseda]